MPNSPEAKEHTDSVANHVSHTLSNPPHPSIPNVVSNAATTYDPTGITSTLKSIQLDMDVLALRKALQQVASATDRTTERLDTTVEALEAHEKLLASLAEQTSSTPTHAAALVALQESIHVQRIEFQKIIDHHTRIIEVTPDGILLGIGASDSDRFNLKHNGEVRLRDPVRWPPGNDGRPLLYGEGIKTSEFNASHSNVVGIVGLFSDKLIASHCPELMELRDIHIVGDIYARSCIDGSFSPKLQELSLKGCQYRHGNFFKVLLQESGIRRLTGDGWGKGWGHRDEFQSKRHVALLDIRNSNGVELEELPEVFSIDEVLVYDCQPKTIALLEERLGDDADISKITVQETPKPQQRSGFIDLSSARSPLEKLLIRRAGTTA